MTRIFRRARHAVAMEKKRKIKHGDIDSTLVDTASVFKRARIDKFELLSEHKEAEKDSHTTAHALPVVASLDEAYKILVCHLFFFARIGKTMKVS
jgi:hypothetical protein